MGEFTDKINKSIKEAMIAKDKNRLATLRDIKSKLLLEATSGGGSDVSDEVANKICLSFTSNEKKPISCMLNKIGRIWQLRSLLRQL